MPDATYITPKDLDLQKMEATARKYGQDLGRQLARAKDLWRQDPQAALGQFPDFSEDFKLAAANAEQG